MREVWEVRLRATVAIFIFLSHASNIAFIGTFHSHLTCALYLDDMHPHLHLIRTCRGRPLLLGDSDRDVLPMLQSAQDLLKGGDFIPGFKKSDHQVCEVMDEPFEWSMGPRYSALL